MKVFEDRELIENCLNGDQAAFEELVRRYKKFIYCTISYYIKDAEEVNDLAQEVFFRIYRNLKTYNPEYKFSTWSAKVSRNLCLDHLRKKKFHLSSLEDYECLSSDDETPESKYIRDERRVEVGRLVDRLPEKYKILLVLYHHKGLSYKEMAQRLEEPMSIIKNRLFRARLAIKENIENMEDVLWN